MANLKTLPGSAAKVRAEHYDSAAAAFAALQQAAGFAPRVLSAAQSSDGISGGARTLAEARKTASGTNSDHYEDNARGHAALDIDNQRAFRNTLGSPTFEAIFAKYGWRNIQINGAPFPSEPWHFARHVSGGGSSSGGGARDDIRWDQERLNVWAAADGVAKIKVDGIRGNETIARTKDFQRKHGLDDDGIAGPKTDAVLATDPTTNLRVDGEWGPNTTRALQRELGVEPDGNFGPISKKALQRYLGVTADGDFGPVSKKALQKHLGVTQDGDIGPVTVKALQTRLNAGTF